jgi:DNA-binding CsgD family transcriptional regulator
VVENYARRFRLSGQEGRLLLCAVRGIPDKCAADELGCSRNTVGTYWKRIFDKTGVRPQRDVLAHLLRESVGAVTS